MEIELKALAERAIQVLDTVHLNNKVRYRSVCFTSNNLGTTEALKNALYIELSDYERWFTPGLGGAPIYGISRSKFENLILSNTSKGLLIYRPEEWITSWAKIEQAAFWSFISMLHGQREVVLITNMNARVDIKRYMNEFVIEKTGVSYWLSNKERK